MPQTRDSIADIWGDRAPFEGDWPPRVDERTVDEPDHWVQSCCVLCSNGCACDIGVKDGKIVGVRGRAGRPGQPGAARPQGAPRLGGQQQPRPPRPGPWSAAAASSSRRAGTRRWAWSSSGRSEIVEKYTGNAIGIYSTGQLFIEDYYTLAIIGKAGLGTPHMDGNTRLCTATAAAGPDGDVRDRRPARLLRRPRPRRRHPPGRPQHGLAADGPLVADTRPPGRARSRRSSS